MLASFVLLGALLSPAQAEAAAKKIATEQKKHDTRVARLNRIKELAIEIGDEKILARAEKLLAKEQARYNKKMARNYEPFIATPGNMKQTLKLPTN